MKKFLLSTYTYDSTGQLEWEITGDDLLPNLRRTYSGSVIQAFLPLLRMGKNFIDTFKPYKNRRQVDDDLTQVFTGIKNTFLALVLLLLYPFGIAIMVKRLEIKPFLLTTFIFPFTLLTTLIAGITQIATFPLTLLRIPCRKLITYFTGVPKIEDNAGIKALVKKGERAAAAGHSTGLIDMVLRQKIKKAKERGQMTKNTAVYNYLQNGIESQMTYLAFLPSKVDTRKIDTSREVTQTAELHLDEEVDTERFTMSRVQNKF